MPVRYTRDVVEVYRHIEMFHGISTPTASERLHAIKWAASLPPSFNLLFDLTGNVYRPDGPEWLGSLTAGGGP